MNNVFYGVGVGPGDPELLTIKAVNCLKNCNIIALANSGGKKRVAYDIALSAVPEIKAKTIIELPMPMTKDEDILRKAHKEAANMLMEALKVGSVAFLTLGDPSVYATYSYLLREVSAMGGICEVIPGVTSFCAAAAALLEPLAESDDMLHIIPASYPLGQALELPGTKVLMKSGRGYSQIKQNIQSYGITNVCMAENCGMKDERLYSGISAMPEEAGYFSTVIVKR